MSGISVGMIYGVIAFGYQLTFSTSKTLNFGQGEALTVGALVGLTTVNVLIGASLGNLWAYLLAMPIVFAFGMLQGTVVEWLGVRQAIRTKSEAGWIMATIALGIIFRNMAEHIWGKDPIKFPSPVSEDPISLWGVNVRLMEIIIVLGALAMMIVLATLFFFGPASTKDFSLILWIGIFVGTYSSVFIASPLLVVLEKWQKRG